MTQQCEFTIESNEEESTGGWRCPHDAAEVSDCHCVFHLTSEEREQVDHDTISETFVECVSSPGRRTKQFRGAYISLLDIEFQNIDAPDSYPIEIQDSTIEYIGAKYSVINQPIIFSDCTIVFADFSHSKLNHVFSIDECDLSGLKGNKSEFTNDFFLTNTETDVVEFNHADFSHVTITNSQFIFGASFQNATFHNTTTFSQSEFQSCHTNIDYEQIEDKFGIDGEEKMNIIYTSYHLSIIPMYIGRQAVDPKDLNEHPFSNANMSKAEGKRPYFSERTFVDDKNIHFNDVHANGADFRSAVFYKNVNFDEVQFDYGDFGNAEFKQEVSFVDTSFFGCLYFHAARFTRVEMALSPIDTQVKINEDRDTHTIDLQNKGRVYLTNSIINEGQLRQPTTGEVYYDIRYSTLRDVDIVSGDNVFRHLIISDTEFDGFDFPSYREELRSNNWLIDTATVSKAGELISPDESSRETTYMRAKNGAANVGDKLAESKFFLQEMRFRAYRHSLNDDYSFLDIFQAMMSVIANQLYRITTGYGEKPHRVVFSYIMLVLFLGSFLTVHNLFEGQPELFIEGFSQTAQAIAFGEPRPFHPEWFADLVAIFRSFVIPIFVALLVFTLTRSIKR